MTYLGEEDEVPSRTTSNQEGECDRTATKQRGLSRKIILGILDDARMRKHNT
jgi:hypothetical protein